MPDKLLIRKNEEGQLLVFVPSREAAKGHIKLWQGGAEYADVKLSAYEASVPADAEETQRKAQEYREITGITSKVGIRMPRHYQVEELGPLVVTADPALYEAVRTLDGLWKIRDGAGATVAMCASEEIASKRLKQLVG